MALSKSRAVRPVKATNLELPGTAQQVYSSGLACWDTSTGLVAKGAASTTMVPIGTFAEDKLVASGGTVLVDLFRELTLIWFKNSGTDAVDAAALGGLCYIDDDETVRKTDNTNTRSVAGRVWRLDTVRGVLVEPHTSAGDRLGGLDA